MSRFMLGQGRNARPLVGAGTGTIFGNFTFISGATAAFDGATNKSSGVCAGTGVLGTGGIGWIGRGFGSAKALDKVICYGSNDAGWDFNNGVGPSVTIEIRGKNGSAPTSDVDGTVLGSLTFGETGNESAGRTVNITNKFQTWDYFYMRINDSGTNNYFLCAQLIPWVY